MALLDRISLVLVEPQEALNIGSALRAAWNMGIHDLRLVEPCAFQPQRIAITAPGLLEVAASLPRYASLHEAIADSVLTLGFTARLRRGRHRVWDLRQFAAELPSLLPEGPGRCHLLFGREDSGLSNEHLDLCHGYVVIPSDPGYSSLNLAQAVLLACYVVRAASVDLTAKSPSKRDFPPARGDDLEGLMAEVRQTLDHIEFFKFEGADTALLRTLRQIFSRACLDRREVSILRGIFHEVTAFSQRRGRSSPIVSDDPRLDQDSLVEVGEHRCMATAVQNPVPRPPDLPLVNDDPRLDQDSLVEVGEHRCMATAVENPVLPFPGDLRPPRLPSRPGFTVFDTVGILLVIAWLASLVLLWTERRGPPAGERLDPLPEEIAAGFREGEEWQGLYFRDEKVGFIRLVRSRIPDGYRFEDWMVMRLSLMGSEQRIELQLDASTDAGFTLTEFNGRMDTSEGSFGIEGRVEPASSPGVDGAVVYRLDMGGIRQEGRIALTGNPLLQFDLRRALLARRPAIGERYETSYFDILSQREQPVILEYLGTEDLSIMDQVVTAHRVVQHLGQQRLTTWVNDLGEVLREELPMGLIGQRESRAQAMYGVLRSDPAGDGGGDFIRSVSVPLSSRPPDLGQIPQITWQIQGIDPAHFDLDGGRQSLLTSGAALILRLDREPVAPARRLSELSPPEEIAPYLNEDPLIQSNAQAIRSQAAEITAPFHDAEAAAQAIVGWVHENMQSRMVVSIPSALAVLDTLSGDCNEHAALATALLRAAGIPARTASGLAYLDDTFYYHAWVEYWLDGWRTADPTWGQMPADLGHIRFVEGGLSRQAALIELFGQVTLEIKP